MALDNGPSFPSVPFLRGSRSECQLNYLVPKLGPRLNLPIPRQLLAKERSIVCCRNRARCRRNASNPVRLENGAAESPSRPPPFSPHSPTPPTLRPFLSPSPPLPPLLALTNAPTVAFRSRVPVVSRSLGLPHDRRRGEETCWRARLRMGGKG